MARLSHVASVAVAVIALTVSMDAAFAKGKRAAAPRAAPAPAPAPVNPAIVADQRDIYSAQTTLAKASKDYNDAVAKLTVDFEKTPEVIAAKKAVADAAAEAAAARQKALDALPASSPYKVAAAKEALAKAELDKLRNAESPDQDAISAKSTEVFADGNAASKLEHNALDLDPAYAAADKKLADANGALTALVNKFKESLKTEDSLATLRTARDDAQTKLAAAQAKLAADRKS